jgi:hypothetical protein
MQPCGKKPDQSGLRSRQDLKDEMFFHYIPCRAIGGLIDHICSVFLFVGTDQTGSDIDPERSENRTYA